MEERTEGPTSEEKERNVGWRGWSLGNDDYPKQQPESPTSNDGCAAILVFTIVR
jgi:hypothetical protein